MKHTQVHKILFPVLAVLGVAIIVLLLFFFLPNNHVVKRVDSVLSEEQENGIRENLKVSVAAYEAQKKAGEVDKSLILEIAWDYYIVGELEMSKEFYDEFLSQHEISYVTWNNYGHLMEKMNLLDDAEYAYSRAIELRAAEAYIRDWVHFIEKHYPERQDEVLELLVESVKTNGQTSWQVLKIAQIYESMGECQKAIDHYKVAITLEDNSELLQAELDRVEASCEEK